MKGIDKIIGDINSLLTLKLWAGNSTAYYGRVWENESENGLKPEIYSNGKYFEVLHNVTKDAQLFWRVAPSNSREYGVVDVSLFVYCNFAKIYPNEQNRDAFEIAIHDIISILNFTQFRYSNTVTGKESFSMWKGASQNKHDMQPWGMFRIDGEISIDSYC